MTPSPRNATFAMLEAHSRPAVVPKAPLPYMPPQTIRHMTIFRYILLALVALCLAAAAWFGYSRWQDQEAFRDVIRTAIISEPGTGPFVEELNEWVYRKEGFAQCQARYVLPPLGPTPMQIFREGGDCSDKSRLLSAMLDSVDMDSTLVMLQPCQDCASTHTVVNAYADDGDVIVADPVYDIVFPDPQGGYYGVAEIRDQPDVLAERLALLKRLRGPYDKIQKHSRDEMKYGFPKTINWDRDPVFRTAGSLVASFTDEPYLVQRPRIMEDPKLFLTIMSLALAAFFALVLFFVRRRDA